MKTIEDLRDLQKAGGVFDFKTIPNFTDEEIKLYYDNAIDFIIKYISITELVNEFRDEYKSIFGE